MTARHLQLYVTTESPCGYYDDRVSRNLVPDPQVAMTMPIYNSLIQHGFRRSGSHCYRPYCKDCSACVACRIRVADFKPDRSQRRCLKANTDLKMIEVPAGFDEEYFSLYQRYVNSRHSDGSMANPDRNAFSDFLYSRWSDTRFLCFYLSGKLVAVAVTDMVADGVSAVYSFFDPDLEKRSLGTWCILQQVEQVKSLGLDYVYLGYWIDGHPKMHYKTRFSPLELYREERWWDYDAAHSGA